MPSTLQVDKIIDGSATTNKELAEYSSGNWSWGSGVPAGSIVQTKFVAFDGIQTIGNGSDSGKTFERIGKNVSGEEFSISMSVSSGNKIIGFGNVNLGASGRYSAIKCFVTPAGSSSVQIASGTATSTSEVHVTVSSMSNQNNTANEYLMHNSSFSFNYTPSNTSSHLYTVEAGNTNNPAVKTYINRTENEDNGTYIHRGYSSFILMEVAQ